MKLQFCSILLVTAFISCGSSEVNHYIKDGNARKRDGFWLENNSTDRGEIISKGKYKNGEKVGVWKTSLNGVRLQREAYRRNLIKTKVFHSNGKIKEKGNSITEITDEFRHWHYNGKWKYFDENGKLNYIKTYSKGTKVDSISARK